MVADSFKVPEINRSFEEYECRDELKAVIIAKSPLEKDKKKIFDSPTGKEYMRTVDKSKLRLKYVHLTYIEDNDYNNFASNTLVTILARYAHNKKKDLSQTKLLFIGQEAFNAFKEDYTKESNALPNFTTYLNEEKQIFKITGPLFENHLVELSYMIINNTESVISNNGKAELISQLDLLNDNLSSDKVEVINNAKYISVDEFINQLDVCKQLYLDKKIKYIAFDIETNTVEWADPWSKICLVSIAEDYNKMAYSCAQYHPELWISSLRRTFLSNLLNILEQCKTIDDNEKYISISKDITSSIKEFRTTTLPNNFEVVSYFEDEFFDELVILLKSLGTKLTKDKLQDGILVKHNLIDEFYKDNESTITKINDLLNNSDNHIQKVKQLWKKLDEVLSIVPIVGQNIKFDVGFLYSKNIAKDKIHIVGDTLAEACMFSKVLDEHGLKMDLDLESLYERETNKQNAWKSAFKSSNRVKVKLLGTRYDNVELDKLGLYSALDSYCTLELHQIYEKKMEERIKEDKCNKVQTFLLEQYKAISMFSSGEVMKWSPLSNIVKILYDESLLDMDRKYKAICELPIVKQYIADHPEDEGEFKINSPKIKADILFDKRYFNFVSVLTSSSGNCSTDTDKVLKVLLSAIKTTLVNNLPEFKYMKGDRGLSPKEKEVKEAVTPELKSKLEQAKIFIESLLDYSMWNKLNTAYITSVWDNDKQQSIPYRANFKIVNATLSGRISSGMHTQPKEGHIRDMYNSIWNSQSNRVIEVKHEIGETYNPDFGLIDIEYEDGTVERTTWKELENSLKH